MTGPEAAASEIAAAVRARKVSAIEVAQAALARAQADKWNAFTAVTADRAMAEAAAVDAKLARGEDPGALAGVPYAVKNLFDIQGLTTLSGSKIDRDLPPAKADATAVGRLKANGAVLIGALNMDEYAFGFTTENTHYGAARNPHDLTRICGGSSGGSGAAAAAGVVPLTLGTDTNGSIRVPASLCGLFGLKPTYGRLSRAGAKLFAQSFDHIGPLARSAADLALAYDAMQGPDARDHTCSARTIELASGELASGAAGLRVGVADGYFARQIAPEAQAAVEAVATALKATRPVSIPEAARARAAAFVITAAEGGNLHLASLRIRAQDFDPHTRDRFLAGALMPGAWVIQAQRFRAWYRAQVLELFRDVDVIVAPATPMSASPIGQEMITLDGIPLPAKPSMGIHTQPISFIGLPVVVAPLRQPGGLPIGVQLIAAPWREVDALRAAAALESMGVTQSKVAA
jgi:1-carboxybiuret hydrolase